MGPQPLELSEFNMILSGTFFLFWKIAIMPFIIEQFDSFFLFVVYLTTPSLAQSGVHTSELEDD